MSTAKIGVHIPEGRYLTITQIADLRSVTGRTVQQWIDKGWIKSIHVPGLGQLIEVNELEGFTPPHRGPVPAGDRKKGPS